MEQSLSQEADSAISWSWNCLLFMEPEGSVPCLQDPTTSTFPEPNESNPHHSLCFSKFYFNVILSSVLRSCKWSLPFRLLNQNFVCISHLPMHTTCHAHYNHHDFINLIIVKSTNYGACHYTTFLSLLSLNVSWV